MTRTPTDLARLAREALIAEAELTPKPGLVDRRGSGCHRDLTLPMMIRSALTLEPFFAEMAALCIGQRPSQSIRKTLAAIGLRAEQALLATTGGVNTHRGAIWTLGLLVSAAAMQPNETANNIAATASEIASFHVPQREQTHGTLMAQLYGVPGARGEALAGFPHIVEIALPALCATRARGTSETRARLDTLLALIATLDDTCILYRGGMEALTQAQQSAKAVLQAGGATTVTGMEHFRFIDQQMLQINISPGGSADLLAATLFLDAIERNLDSIPRDQSQAKEDVRGSSHLHLPRHA
jgi:triphosphoribosyl-dephospho-CoA synthase